MRALTLRLPDEVHEALRREAYESRRSMNDLVLEALNDRTHEAKLQAAYRRSFKIIDRDTRSRSTIASYPTEVSAWNEIHEWQYRNSRGGRPDITTEMLERMIVVPEDGDYS